MSRWVTAVVGMVFVMGSVAWGQTASINFLTDNRADIAYANGSSVGCWLQPTNLSQAWSNGGTVYFGSFNTVALGDVNGDGRLDAAWAGNSWGAWRGDDGSATFGADPGIILFDQITAMDLLDINGDGKTDALLTDMTTNQIRWRVGGVNDPNPLSGLVWPIAQGNTGSYNTSNATGVKGYVLGRSSGTYNVMTLWSADSTGSSAGGVYWRILNDGSTGAAGTLVLTDDVVKAVAMGDIKNDGTLDAIYAHGSKISYRELSKTGGGSIGGVYDLVTGLTGAQALTLGDINGDGKLDLVYSDTIGTYFELGNGNGTFGSATLLGGPTVSLSMMIVPEPATISLIMLGMFGLIRRKK